MSIESARDYVARLGADDAFARRIAVAGDAVARSRIARSEGFEFSKSEMDLVAAELSEEQLAELNRGAWTGARCECSREGELGCRAPSV